MSIHLVKGPITTDLISARVASLGSRRETGGHSIFLGQVRADIIEGKTVKAIAYSAYGQMVDSEADKIAEQILGEYDDLLSVEILHSEGIVNVGEISLYIMVSGGHRDQVSRACRHTVELIKERLPVWKKELFEDESHRWKENDN